MSVDINMVKRVAKLANIRLDPERIEKMRGEIDVILQFVDQLGDIDVEGVEPMTSVVDMTIKRRADRVIDGGNPEDVLANAPASEDNFFMMPKVIE